MQRRFDGFEREFCQIELERTPFSLREVVDEVRERLFPEIAESPPCIFCKGISLASIYPGANPVRIQISTLLNTALTPRSVIEHIVTHELLHLLIPPREVDGKLTSHPPEFWERERTLSPGGPESWSWIWRNYALALKSDPDAERICVDLVLQRRGISTGR